MGVRASVAMAVCNGEEYLQEQIDSIIDMMNASDELVISYDKSTDRTLEIIQDYERQYPQIKVVFNERKSVESNFNNAVAHCNGKFIFLSDQDDVWINDKINRMIAAVESDTDITVVIGNGYLCDKELKVLGTISGKYQTSVSPLRNFIKGSYLGCQMMFTSNIKDKVWPVKISPPLPHDLWLGILGAKYGKVLYLDEKFIKHRLHEHNYSNTSKMKLLRVVQNRLYLGYELLKRTRENKTHG